MPKKLSWTELLPFASTTEENYLKALIKHGSGRKAAKSLGRSRSALRDAIKRVELKASIRAKAPEFGVNRPTALPDNLALKGISELVDNHGVTRLTWFKSEKVIADLTKQMETLFDSICERVDKKAIPVPIPDITDAAKDLAVIVPMGDPHVGLYTWAAEAETDFDCKIAEELLVGAVEHLVDISPEAEEFILINLGDFFHSDNVNNRTDHGGNALDVDGRWAKVQEIGFWIMIRCIDRALAKYPHVTVHNAIGNHDEHTSQALAATVSAWYRNEPRVTVIKNPSVFWYHQWGKCMLAVHHGHTTKFQTMPLTMAAQEPEMWGNTLFRYCYMGHLHHNEKKEYPGVTVEQFRTLAPKDAWHFTHGGFISMRDMQSIHLHKKYGEVGRRICPVEYLERKNNE